MIYVPFVAPNYRYEFRSIRWEEQEDGESGVALISAENEEDLKQKLVRLRRRALWITPYNFDEWQRRAAKATAKTIRSFTEGNLKFQENLWQELKTYLFTLFNGKCAYCEAIVEVVSPGDVEHYRPKRRVDGVAHRSGYYWLAYDIMNLLPSCAMCNRYGGKRNQFPIAGRRSFSPNDYDQLEDEEPLLLHPLVDKDIEAHFQHWTCRHRGEEELCGGFLRGITDRGKTSVKVYNLAREHLVHARFKAQKDARTQLRMAFVRSDAEFKSLLAHYLADGDYEYSAAVKEFVRDWWQNLSS